MFHYDQYRLNSAKIEPFPPEFESVEQIIARTFYLYLVEIPHTVPIREAFRKSLMNYYCCMIAE